MTIEANGKDTDWHIVGTYSIAGDVNPPQLYVNYEYISRIIGGSPDKSMPCEW